MSTNSQLLIYQTSDGNIKIDVRLDEETVWLTQKLMAELFQVKPQNITMHLKNIYEEGELSEEANCKEFLQVQTEGNRKVERKQKFYNLDAIISVGYRIKSHVATQFRIWATQRLKEYIVKGFTLNSERFKTGQSMIYFLTYKPNEVDMGSLLLSYKNWRPNDDQSNYSCSYFYIHHLCHLHINLFSENCWS